MLESIELRVPVANENETTPMNMMMMQMILSASVPPDISPKPTVVIVVNVKYNAAMYS